MSVKLPRFHGLHLTVVFILACLCLGLKQDCPPPDVPTDGNYEPKMNMFLPGSNVTYFCNDGFILDGSSIRECQLNGIWSETTPFCDYGKTFKILRGSMRGDDYLTDSSMFDGNTKSCYFVLGGESVLLELETEVVVRGVKMYLSNGFEDIDVYSGLGNNTTLCASHKGYSFQPAWLELKCGSHGVLADKIEIQKELEDTESSLKSTTFSICDIRVLGFGRQFDYGCTHPPEITVDNGYFEVSRTKATLICEDGYTSDNSGLDCGQNTWKGPAPMCEKAEMEVSTRITIGVAVAGVLIILLLLGIIIYMVRKQKATRKLFTEYQDEHRTAF